MREAVLLTKIVQGHQLVICCQNGLTVGIYTKKGAPPSPNLC